MDGVFSLDEKVVVITGGSGHLGSAMTEGLLEFGASVVVGEIAEKKPEEIISDGMGRDRLSVIKCDVSDTLSVKKLFSDTKELYGKIDVLINCAAYWPGTGIAGTVEQMTDADFICGIEGTMGTTFRCTREAVPYLEESGGGAIVNIGSMYGIVSPDPRVYGDSGQNNPPNYATGKAAVVHFTKYCAAHLAKKNIRVNCVSPGPFPNPAKVSSEEFMRILADKTMLGRIGSPKDLVGAIILLASDASAYMTGSNIVVDGGWTAW